MHVTAVSNWLSETAKQSFLSQYPIQTIYNGIDCNLFCPQQNEQVKKKYNLQNKFINYQQNFTENYIFFIESVL